MSDYFDKDFFKFLLGFLGIIAVSFMLLMFARAYERGRHETASVIQGHNQKNPQ